MESGSVQRERLMRGLREWIGGQTRRQRLLERYDQIGATQGSQLRKLFLHAQRVLMLFDMVVAHLEELVRHGQRLADQASHAVGLVNRVGLQSTF